MELKLETKSKEQEKIKEYLEQNASDTLKDKINNGVKIIKDDKTLINKKDLDGFMKFACDKARKQAEKGANFACIEDIVVYGWAIHYFEEDSIEGKLYNQDGTEYQQVKPKVSVQTQAKIVNKPKIKKKESNQASLFDLLANNTETNSQQENVPLKDKISTKSQSDPLFEDEEEFTDEEMDAIVEENKEIENEYLIDKETGEVLSPVKPVINEEIQPIEKEYAIILSNILDGKLEMKL